jgi:hypothetical protein
VTRPVSGGLHSAAPTHNSNSIPQHSGILYAEQFNCIVVLPHLYCIINLGLDLLCNSMPSVDLMDDLDMLALTFMKGIFMPYPMSSSTPPVNAASLSNSGSAERHSSTAPCSGKSRATNQARTA